jgi:signal transduction histidine kinase
VADSGKGIEPERLPHVFEKFNQSTNTDYTKKSIHGTGLGLHLCKQIVELLGGEINATSTIDIGSSFTFYIPLSYDTITP